MKVSIEYDRAKRRGGAKHHGGRKKEQTDKEAQ